MKELTAQGCRKGRTSAGCTECSGRPWTPDLPESLWERDNLPLGAGWTQSYLRGIEVRNY